MALRPPESLFFYFVSFFSYLFFSFFLFSSLFCKTFYLVIPTLCILCSRRGVFQSLACINFPHGGVSGRALASNNAFEDVTVTQTNKTERTPLLKVPRCRPNM